MPVEIKELIIRALVRKDDLVTPAESATQDDGDERETIVEACVQQVLQILKKSKER